MTQKIAVDENNDWYLGKDKHLAIATDLQAVLEECEHTAKVVIGELVFNQSKGVLSFSSEGTFGNVPDLFFYDSRLRRAFEALTDVIEVEDLNIRRVDDVLSYAATIKTVYGSGDITG